MPAGMASCMPREANASPSVVTYLIATPSRARLSPMCFPILYSDSGSVAGTLAVHPTCPGQVTFNPLLQSEDPNLQILLSSWKARLVELYQTSTLMLIRASSGRPRIMLVSLDLSSYAQFIHCCLCTESCDLVCCSRVTGRWCVYCPENVTERYGCRCRILQTDVKCNIRCGSPLTTASSFNLTVQLVHA